KELEVPISNNGVEGLARPDEPESSDYESGGGGTTNWGSGAEEMTDQEETPPSELRTEEAETPSPAIYLAILEEVPTPEEEEEPAAGGPKTDLENLTEGERGEVAKLFEMEKELFAKSLDELTQTDRCSELGSNDTVRSLCIPNGMARNDEDDSVLPSLREGGARDTAATTKRHDNT
ncbi:4766_t:CDS:2, partial [Acaulospora morrowiae]